MIKTTLPAKRAVSEIVRGYRQIQGEDDRPASLRGFAASLSEVLEPYAGSISHQSVKNWEDRTHLPHPFYMIQIASHAPLDWRRDFAHDVLAVLQPETYRAATQIGARALAEYGLDGGAENARQSSTFAATSGRPEFAGQAAKRSFSGNRKVFSQREIADFRPKQSSADKAEPSGENDGRRARR